LAERGRRHRRWRAPVRQADCPNRSPGSDCETQHQDSLYRDWRRRA